MRRVIRAALAMAFAAWLTPASADPLAPGAASCLACHTDGSGLPDLGALSPQQIEAALAGYRGGTRTGTVMPRLAKGFSAEESRAIAEALGRGGAAR